MMTEVTRNGTRLEQLQELAMIIAATIDAGDDTHSMAQLARQYRETIREIAELSDEQEEDVISQLVAGGG